MSELTRTTPIALPTPRTPLTIRPATLCDVPFMDALQKKHSKELGFFPRAQMEGYINTGRVLVAEASTSRIAYVSFSDRYLKRDELGMIAQMCVDPNYRRGFVAASLLKEVFARSAYGCKLYCCWCAQDLAANRFWEAMGFVPIAYRAGGLARRAGSSSRKRVHIYWQKRIRAGDTTTPYWFPAKTEGGAIREDRIILPIPPSLHWTDELPVLDLGEANSSTSGRTRKEIDRKSPSIKVSSPAAIAPMAVRFGPPGMNLMPRVPAPVAPNAVNALATIPPKRTRTKAKANPALIARARELRDRWAETIQARPDAVESHGKYQVARAVSRSPDRPALAA